jgi:hypothetical protein
LHFAKNLAALISSAKVSWEIWQSNWDCCQGQLGNLAVKLGLIDKRYPLEAACFATLFSRPVDEKIKNIMAGYSTILLFSFAADLKKSISQITGSRCFLIDLKKSISQITGSRCFLISPRPPAQVEIHVTEFLFKNLVDNGLLEAADSDDRIFARQRKQTHGSGRPIDTSKIIIHPGSGLSTRAPAAFANAGP